MTSGHHDFKNIPWMAMVEPRSELAGALGPSQLDAPLLRGPSRIPNLSCFHTEYLMPYGAGFTMVLVSNVTAPLLASALPFSVAPVFSVIDANAKMFPLKTEYVPRVAELPTCQ